jgi:hypothetical protein
MRKLVVLFAIFAVSLAWAKSYNLTLFEPSVIGGTELKPGEYKLELKSDTVVISNGKQSGEASVKVENADAKFSSTTVRYSNGDGKYRIQEIRLGGTKMKLVLN